MKTFIFYCSFAGTIFLRRRRCNRKETGKFIYSFINNPGANFSVTHAHRRGTQFYFVVHPLTSRKMVCLFQVNTILFCYFVHLMCISPDIPIFLVFVPIFSLTAPSVNEMASIVDSKQCKLSLENPNVHKNLDFHLSILSPRSPGGGGAESSLISFDNLLLFPPPPAFFQE